SAARPGSAPARACPRRPARRSWTPSSRCAPRRAVAAALVVVAIAACGRKEQAPAVAAPAQTPAQAPASAIPHGDHNPHHGGVVMMKGSDLHYEVVLDPTGRS